MRWLSRGGRPVARRLLTRVDQLDPTESQRETLLDLVRTASQTRYGRAHDFGDVRDVADFQDRAPLMDYESMREAYWAADHPRLSDVSWPGEIPFFALTSGTTSGRTKFIPVSREMIRSNSRTGLRVLMRHLVEYPRSAILDGRSLWLGGSVDLEWVAPGIRTGDLSGIAAATRPWWSAPLFYPGRRIAEISDWDRRIEAILADPASRRVRSIAGQSTWLLAFLEAALEIDRRVGCDIRDSFPELELIVCGGMNYAPYRNRFEALSSSGRTSVRECYAASEGVIGLGNGLPGNGVRLVVDNGIFFEFVPLDELGAASPTRHWIATVEPKRDYAIAVSTNAGAWAYLIGDVVRFIDTDLPLLLVVGRTDQVLSAFGERLIEAEITEAVTTAARRLGIQLVEFVVAPVYPDNPARPGRHRFIIEIARPALDKVSCKRLAELIDETLQKLNHDYRSIRSGDLVVARPDVCPVPPGTFDRWMHDRGKIGGQNKMPRIVRDCETLDRIRATAAPGSA